jgi:hypothetical protein
MVIVGQIKGLAVRIATVTRLDARCGAILQAVRGLYY